MKIPFPIRNAAAICSVVLALTAFGFQFWQWREYGFVRESVSMLLAGQDIGPERRFGAPASVRLAYALYLSGREDYRAAEELLAELGQFSSPDIAARALYDLGNVYLRRAIAAVERDEPAQAGPLAELAKQAYRRALRSRPDDWAAKYNYEVAARLMPDFDRIDNGTEEPDEKSARKLWTRVPGFPRGLP